MLGLLDKSLLVAMPTKCGTERLKSALVRLGVAEEKPQDHGMRQYEGYAMRLLLVRDPLERWVSTYWWLRSTEANQGFKRIVGDHLTDFNSFAALVAGRPSRAYVFRPLSDYVESFEPDLVQPLETLVEAWTASFDASWLPKYLNTAPHATRNREPLGATVTERLPRGFRRFAQKEYAALRGTYGTLRKRKPPVLPGVGRT